MRYLPVLLAIALVVYCVVDIAGSTQDERLGLPRGIWVLLVLVPFVGALAWLVVSRSRRAAVAQAGTGVARGGRDAAPRRRHQGPVAPDDDPEFLRRLDQERRRREAEGRGEAGDGQRPE
jgi:hypothetical protein